VTPAEIALLRSLCETDVVTFMPESNTAAARAKYEATLESLRDTQQAGWVELEVNKATQRQRGRSGVKPRRRRGARRPAGMRCGCWESDCSEESGTCRPPIVRRRTPVRVAADFRPRS
jgi:hypothetical protein